MGETVTCSVCGVGLGHRFHVSFYGRFCSETCRLVDVKRRDALYEELLAEPMSDLPEHLSVADFERFALKLGLHAIREDAGKSVSSDPARAILSDPEVLAFAIKERIIGELPEGYVIAKTSRALFGPDYLYSFKATVPRSVVIKAAQDAGVVQPPSPS